MEVNLLKLDLVSFSYGLIKALQEVSIVAKLGSVTCILGPNGAGKSTLMQLIAGVLKPSSGCIEFNGLTISSLKAPQIVKNGISLVPENRLIFPEMSVRENLLVGAFSRRSQLSAEQISDEITEIGRRFPVLKKRENQLGGTLSGGEQQMLAIGRALMSKPKILLMDEPSVGLAPLIVDEIFSIITELKKDGMSVLLVEQNARKALEVANYFYLLDKGKVTYSGIPDDIESDDLIKQAYLGGNVENY